MNRKRELDRCPFKPRLVRPLLSCGKNVKPRLVIQVHTSVPYRYGSERMRQDSTSHFGQDKDQACICPMYCFNDSAWLYR